MLSWYIIEWFQKHNIAKSSKQTVELINICVLDGLIRYYDHANTFTLFSGKQKSNETHSVTLLGHMTSDRLICRQILWRKNQDNFCDQSKFIIEFMFNMLIRWHEYEFH